MPVSRLANHIATAPRPHTNDCPLWTGPYGAGPLGGITQSMLVRFISCRERFRLKYVLGLEPPDRWVKTIGYGNMWHLCEEHFAKDQRGLCGEWQCRLEEYTRQQIAKYRNQADEIEKWFHVCSTQFPIYIAHWQDHPDVLDRTPLMQEQVFDTRYVLTSGRVVRLRGKFDSVDLIDGGIYLQENKTKGDVDKIQIERQLKFDLQTMLYLIALQSEPIPLPHTMGGYEVRGVRYNVVKRDCPIKQHEGRMLKAGWKPGETTEHWIGRLRDEYYGARPQNYFFRIRAEVSAHDIEVFRETCLDPLLEQLCWWYAEVTMGAPHKLGATWFPPPMNYRTPFGVWSALEEGGSTEYDMYLATGSEVGLRRVETLFTELQT